MQLTLLLAPLFLLGLTSAAALPLDPAPGLENIDPVFLSHLEDLFAHPEHYDENAITPAVAARGVLSTTRNDMIPCRPILTLFARGTYELGNIGAQIGAPLFAALDALLPGQTGMQGVQPYPALVAGYLLAGSAIGAESLRTMLQTTAKRCPNTKIVVGGYSQGAQVVHRALEGFDREIVKKVAAVVLFGDPEKGRRLGGGLEERGAVKTWCNAGDMICQGVPWPLGPHLEYKKRAAEAAAWVKGMVV